MNGLHGGVVATGVAEDDADGRTVVEFMLAGLEELAGLELDGLEVWRKWSASFLDEKP